MGPKSTVKGDLSVRQNRSRSLLSLFGDRTMVGEAGRHGMRCWIFSKY